jgi:hypothetical protein
MKTINTIFIILSNLNLILAIYYDCVGLNQSIALENYDYINANSLTIKNFKRFNEIKFNCTKTINISVLQFIPDTKIILDNGLNLRLAHTDRGINRSLSNLKGIDAYTNSEFNLNTTYLPNGFYIDISYSHFVFYANNTLFDSNLCIGFVKKSPTFFRNTKNLTLVYV